MFVLSLATLHYDIAVDMVLGLHAIFSLHLSASNMPERLEIDKIPLLIQQVPAIHAYKTFSLL